MKYVFLLLVVLLFVGCTPANQPLAEPEVPQPEVNLVKTVPVSELIAQFDVVVSNYSVNYDYESKEGHRRGSESESASGEITVADGQVIVADGTYRWFDGYFPTNANDYVSGDEFCRSYRSRKHDIVSKSRAESLMEKGKICAQINASELWTCAIPLDENIQTVFCMDKEFPYVDAQHKSTLKNYVQANAPQEVIRVPSEGRTCYEFSANSYDHWYCFDDVGLLIDVNQGRAPSEGSVWTLKVRALDE